MEIHGACPDQFLNRMNAKHVAFWGLTYKDPFTIQLCIFARDLKKTEDVGNSTFCDINDIRKCGWLRFISKIIKRPILIFGVIISMLAIIYLQNYILFFRVEGNGDISQQEILRALEALDIGFGIYGPDIKPKWIKDHILARFPQLQWITVTQTGSIANVIVKQRETVPDVTHRRGLANIVASKSGRITKQSVLEGQALKSVGDIVQQGEMLVSGVVDLETRFLVVRAKAEIYANTWYDIGTCIPRKWSGKTSDGNKRICVWLEIGKRRIKIFGNSGISHTECDKMIDRKILTLPGECTLPVEIVVEYFYPYKTESVYLQEQDAVWLLQAYADKRVDASMIAGYVVDQNYIFSSDEECYTLQGKYECNEMIAQTAEGKWNKEDFDHD